MDPKVFAPAPFNGRRFRNLSGRPAQGLPDVVRWMRTRRPATWPAQLANEPAPKPLEQVDDGSIRATIVGHATVLLQVAGLNILTDPVWSQRIGPVSWAGPRRVRAPAIAFGDLPRIDLVLLSHNHYDHLDRPTLAALAGRDNPLILTGLKVGKAVPSTSIVELDWWQSHALPRGACATYVPAEHASARGPFDRNKTLWGGFVLQTDAGTVYFAGDTARGEHFTAVKERFGPITLSLLPIGAYCPRWFMQSVHVDPAEAVAASIDLASQVSLAMHYGTFHLADEAIDAPAQELQRALSAARGAPRGLDFRAVAFGQPLVVTAQTAAAANA
jgi:L-ascorbate metabolism protein UlaG (beta-lactamase superfamily)